MNKQDLKFINSYFKGSYDNKQRLQASEGDVSLRQAPLKTFLKVNQEKGTDYKYSFKKHLDRMYETLPTESVKELIPLIDEINSHTSAKC